MRFNIKYFGFVGPSRKGKILYVYMYIYKLYIIIIMISFWSYVQVYVCLLFNIPFGLFSDTQTYARQSLPLVSDGSLEVHTYCDIGHPFWRSWQSHLLLSVCHLNCHYPSRPGFGNPTSRTRNKRSIDHFSSVSVRINI